jgi:hypothetical protein
VTKSLHSMFAPITQEARTQPLNNSNCTPTIGLQIRSHPVSAITGLWGGIICLRKRAPWPHRLLSFAGLRFRGLGCGKFPISVWLGAQGTGMQFTSFLGGCTTCRTRYGYICLRDCEPGSRWREQGFVKIDGS